MVGESGSVSRAMVWGFFLSFLGALLVGLKVRLEMSLVAGMDGGADGKSSQWRANAKSIRD